MSDTLMVSVSGMRGIVGVDLTPELVSRYAAALGAWTARRHDGTTAGHTRVVLGRDARTSGEMFTRAATAGLQSVGVEVIDVGLAPTPTVQMAVEYHHAGAGLILTASHNPIEWNALKFVGPDGIFLDADAGAAVRAMAEAPAGPPRAGWDRIGQVRQDRDAISRHLDLILDLPEVDAQAIQSKRFTVALDCVRGAGGTTMPLLLERLGCEVAAINLETDGLFPRPPEPLPEHLGGLGRLVRESGAAVGIAVDPDVDRLAIVDERGEAIGEDYTLAFAVRAVLGERRDGQGRAGRAETGEGTDAPVVVANLSTSLVVEDAARAVGARYLRAPVGEANVARMMRDEGAVVGGEGNGGVILPALHIGRDAPLAAALLLTLMARTGRGVAELVQGAPQYRIVKAKAPRSDLNGAYAALKTKYRDAEADERDGLRLGWRDRWLHLRPSGTEPIVRLIAEAPTAADAETLISETRALLGAR